MDAPLTPDFATYTDTPGLRVLDVDDSFVTVSWPDGRRHRFHHLFLAENAGEGIIDPLTRERLVDPTTLPLAMAPEAVTVDADHLVLVWPDHRTTTVHGGWLRAMAEGAGTVAYGMPAPVLWDTSTMAELPTADGPTVLADDDALSAWLVTLLTYGVARLRDLPTTDSTVAAVAERIGVIRDTSFGRLFEVRSKPDADSIAYTAHPLTAHTDLPTRELPPGFQLLHCRENTCTAGHSVMVDGFTVAARLRAEQPEAWADLTTTCWVHTNRSPSFDYRWSAPVLHLGPDGEVDEVRLLHTLRTLPEVPDHQVGAAYTAVRAFSEIAARPEYALRSAFVPGDLVMFDNRRVLHGRDGFDPRSGHRHLQGCYIDRDEVRSRLRILQRTAAAHGCGKVGHG